MTQASSGTTYLCFLSHSSCGTELDPKFELTSIWSSTSILIYHQLFCVRLTMRITRTLTHGRDLSSISGSRSTRTIFSCPPTSARQSKPGRSTTTICSNRHRSSACRTPGAWGSQCVPYAGQSQDRGRQSSMGVSWHWDFAQQHPGGDHPDMRV